MIISVPVNAISSSKRRTQQSGGVREDGTSSCRAAGEWGGRSQGQTGLDFKSESGMPQYDFITKKVYVNL